jgi:hypothetical protein
MANISRSRLQRFLEGVDYPASKQELIQHARSRGADDDVIDVLQQLPSRRYNGPSDVSDAMETIE